MGKPKGESRGLAYLQKARPEAISHLLKFFGESGKHLEPKTRFLISVVTKVINLSPRGLEQYVKRAIEEGATPDEVIDAVLCSYPCAGLTRVVDAIDVILDMGLPGFEAMARDVTATLPAAPPAPSEPEKRWVKVAEGSELPDGGALHVVAGRLELALFGLGADVVAVDHGCPHKFGPIAQGIVQGDVVTCPLHAWKFHLRTGECVNHPGARIRTYPTRKTEANAIEVLLPVP